MIWREVSRTEWLCAALVTTVSVASTLLLMRYAASVDELTERKQVKFECKEAAPAMTSLPWSEPATRTGAAR